MLTLCIGEVGRPRSTAPEGLISPRSLTPVVSIHLDCSHFNRLTVAGLLFSRTLQAPLFKAPQDLDACLVSHLFRVCVRTSVATPTSLTQHLIPRDYSLSRGTSIKPHSSFEGLSPLYPCVLVLLSLSAVLRRRRLLPSTAPLQPHFRRRRPSTALLPPVELAPLPCVSSHLYCRRRTVYLALLIGLLLWCFQDPTTHSTRQRRRRRQPLAAKTTEEAILPSFGPIELKLGSKIEPKLS